MIFVILGSQKFQFNRLLKKIDMLIEEGVITDSVFAQIGTSDYTPKHYEGVSFLDGDLFKKKIEECSVVITHGGSGAIIGAVTKGKKVIAIPRLARYGEHVDDHQLQLVSQFAQMRIVLACFDVQELGEVYKKIDTVNLRSYQSNTKRMIDSLEEFIKEG